MTTADPGEPGSPLHDRARVSFPRPRVQLIPGRRSPAEHRALGVRRPTNPWFLQPVSGQGQIRAQQMGLGAEFRFPQVPDLERARLLVAKSSRLPSTVPGVQAEQDCPPAPGVSGAGELALTEVMPGRPVPAVTQR